MLKRHLSASTLDKILRSELIPESDEERKKGFIPWIKNVLLRKNHEKE